jgi:competence protein ComEA
VTDLLRPSPPPSWREHLSEAVAAARARPAVAAAIAVVAVAAGIVGLVVFGHRSQPPPLTLPRASAQAAPATPTTSVDLVVHVAGAVRSPGLVKLPSGTRVGEAITAAGGPAPDADIDQVNLAARVGDGDRIYVPRRGEAPPPVAAGGGSTAKPGPVDLNSATPEQLDALPGVGPATANAIVQYRTRHGRFRTVDNLLDVPGIGPAKLSTLRPLVKT